MREYNIFIDENLPPQIARGLQLLQEPLNSKEGIIWDISSIKDRFGQGASDEEWIPQIGKLKGIVITQDYRIQTLKHQRKLYTQNGVGILFFSPPSNKGFSYWEMVKQVITRWDEIKKIAKKHRTPFAFRCSSRSGFENIS